MYSIYPSCKKKKTCICFELPSPLYGCWIVDSILHITKVKCNTTLRLSHICSYTRMLYGYTVL